MSTRADSAAAPAAGPLPDLSFAIEDASAVDHAAVPTLSFRLRIESAGGVPIRAILLTTQIQIAARRRPYDELAQRRLAELFGTPDRWGSTLRTLSWVRETSVVPAFENSALVDLRVVCTLDLEVAASRYMHSLEDGEVPLEFLFSGTVFYGAPLQAARISWDSEAEYGLPVRVWKETMERHFRDTAWLRVRKERFDRLVAYKSRRALATWEDVIDELLERA
jgi:Family of unknown function (DUF6084)